MPEGGRLNPGDKVNAPTVIIPGQAEDDPNTPADERLLKKQPGFFTNPGRDDFDYDADKTADASDPEPQNPSVPTASSGSSDPSSTSPDFNEPLDTSQEPRPEPLSEIPETARAKDLAEAKAAELRNTLPKKDRPAATAAAVDTETGKVYYGTSGKPLPTIIDEYLAERMPVPSEEKWEVSNCAEFKAVNDALLDGANIMDLEVHTVRTRSGEAYSRCRNCRKTIDSPNVTSDP
ncbi:YwqJ-related putative deaminase [Nostoc sp.]|uniref:YwqJ-related putative deaminase n=1 Tax=Nostoc sp. TaxID=1180 RepID=UPI002FF62AAF